MPYPLCTFTEVATVTRHCPVNRDAASSLICPHKHHNLCLHESLSTPEQRREMMATATAEKSEAAESSTGNGAQSPGQSTAAQSTAIAKAKTFNVAFDNIRDPMDFVAKFGDAMHASGMFGCKTKDQGRVLAMACLCERKNPLELTRLYHLVDGKLSMRADAMLAEFRGRGGEHKLIARTPDEAAIELTIGKGKGATKEIFRLTFKEVVQEPFPWAKGGKKFLPDGSPDPKQLKDNWATPRARMQMLWARVVSDGVRTLMPEVVAGSYTPEEIGDITGTAIGVNGEPEPIDVPFEPARHAEPADAAKAPEPATLDSAAAAEAGLGTVAGSGAADAGPSVDPAPATVAPEPAAATLLAEVSGPSPSPITRDQLIHIANLKAELNPTDEVWKKTLRTHYQAESARDLNYADAENLLSRLWTLAMQRREEARRQELNEWATRESAGNPPATAGEPGDAPGN